MNMVFMFFLGTFAVWRLSSMFSRESGPFHMFVSLRKWLFVGSFEYAHSFIGNVFSTLNDGINCMMCNSVWFSALVSLAISHGIIEWAVITLALSTCSIFLEEVWQLLKQTHS